MKKGRLMRTGGAVLLLSALLSPTARGQKWAKDMFEQTSHDFGTVARGAKVEHRFNFENIYEEDVHIASVRSTCGCISWEYPKKILKTWDKGDILVKVDTRGYYGRKDSALRVVFDKPFPAEVRLQVHTYIRSDVVVQPGLVRFGSIPHGTAPPPQKVSVDYAGRQDWKIVKVESANPHLQAEAVEKYRSAGRVSYTLTVAVKDDAPVGYIRDYVVLVTNDYNPRSKRVPVPVEGVVSAAVTVRPSPLLLGVVKVGDSITKRLVVQAKKPFRVVGVRCDDARFEFSVRETSANLHLILVAFTAGETAENVTQKVRIETDSEAGRALEVPVHVRVIP